jgi:hypothetical protein
MKKIALTIVTLSTMLVACNSAADKIKPEEERQSMNEMVSNTEVAAMTFEETFFDFGDIPEGKQNVHIFNFENTGEVPLVITSATGSCGCTVPEWPRTPIAPGATGEIKVSFDSTNRSGKQDKTVTIEANTVPRTTVLKITSNVMPKTAQ